MDLNWSLTARLNAADEFRWLVMENSHADSPERLSPDDRRFAVVEGQAPGKTGSPFPEFHVANYNHAASLNQALQRIDTPYALFLDPDFFIVRSGWIGDVLTHMHARGLSFFGAPYYPDRRRKYRYFPCVWCLFVDLNRVHKADLDFTPDYDEQKAAASLPWTEQVAFGFFHRRGSRVRLSANVTSHMIRAAFLMRLAGRLPPRLRGLAEVMCSHDVGHRIYHSFYRKPGHASECLVPSWKNPLYSPPPSLAAIAGRVARRWIVPERLSAYPKRRGYSTGTFFRDFGLPDLVAREWPEYLWREQPFGFHVSGLFRGKTAMPFEALVDLVQRCARTSDLGPLEAATMRT